MIYTIQRPENINIKVNLPASKSISNRVLILNALCKKPFKIVNLSESDDTKTMLYALENDEIEINVGAAGTSMRFLTAYYSQIEKIKIITGTERMKNRPIKILVDALREVGADIDYLEKEGFPPLQIKGKKLHGGTITINGSISSQFLSALMMIAPYMKHGLNIKLEGDIISLPYIMMTVQLMERFGVKTIWSGQTIQIEPQVYHAIPFKVESDWSAASYWYEILALSHPNSSVVLNGLENNSLQGDAKCVEIFKLIESNDSTKIFYYDFTNEPDLVQTFVVTCCLLNIPFTFKGVQSLRIKETDRILALQTELKKLGYLIENEADKIITWNGERCKEEIEPIISTYDDHRMAMAFAPVCLKTKVIKISDPDVVTKSYPYFWDDLTQAGFMIKRDR